MPSRYIKKAIILAKTEVTQGVDAVPTGAANAIKAFDMSINPLEMAPITLPVMAGWFGSDMSVPGSSYVKCSFSVALAGAGLAATAPAWGALLLACASTEVTGLLTPNRVEYLPATDALKSATIYYYDDGLLHKLVGCMGAPKLSAKAGEVAKLTFDFVGLDGGASAAANAVATLTAWKDPVALTAANVVDIKLGCTYATGALTGGTAYNSTGLTLDWGAQPKFTPMLTTEDVVFDGRKIKGEMSLELTAVQEVAMLAAIKARTVQGLGFVIGKTSGNQIMLHGPAMVLTGLTKGELSGKRLAGLTFELDPVAGNDELRIVSL